MAGSKDGDGGTNKHVVLSTERQRQAFEQAREVVSNDVDRDMIDARVFGDSPTDGEIVRIVCEAYAGFIEWSDYGDMADDDGDDDHTPVA